MNLKAKALVAALGLLGAISGPALAEEKKDADTKEKKPVSGKEVKKPAKQGADSACGEGSCGTDKKGAEAAKKAHGKSKTHVKSK